MFFQHPPSLMGLIFKSVLLITTLFGLTACQQEAPELTAVTQQAHPTSVQIYQVPEVSTAKTLTFPATVAPVRQINIAFEVGGKIAKANLPEGKSFKKGDLLAKLNTANFERKLKLTQLKVKEAKTELDRMNAVDRKGYISKQNVTKAEMAYEMALVEQQMSQQDLAYAKLIAPFDGVVSKRFVEENSFVGPGTKIATIQDVSQVYLAFDLPEKIMARVNKRDVLGAKVTISGRDEIFEAIYAEHEANPNPVTQTYRVYFKMAYPKQGQLPMGVHAKIAITLSSTKGQETTMKVPFSALASDAPGKFYVWRLTHNQVEKTAVKIGQLLGKEVEILSGIQAGDKVISAGVSKMREAMIVTEFNGGV